MLSGSQLLLQVKIQSPSSAVALELRTVDSELLKASFEHVKMQVILETTRLFFFCRPAKSANGPAPRGPERSWCESGWQCSDTELWACVRRGLNAGAPEF